MPLNKIPKKVLFDEEKEELDDYEVKSPKSSKVRYSGSGTSSKSLNLSTTGYPPFRGPTA